MDDNELGAPGFKHLAEGLRHHKALTELNVSSNCATNTMDGTGNTDMEGVSAFADAIPTMGAMVTVTINTFALPIQDIKTKSELDFADKGLCVEDAIIIAALIPLNVSRRQRLSCYCLLMLLL